MKMSGSFNTTWQQDVGGFNAIRALGWKPETRWARRTALRGRKNKPFRRRAGR